jgi:hypothetical protein
MYSGGGRIKEEPAKKGDIDIILHINLPLGTCANLFFFNSIMEDNETYTRSHKGGKGD